MNTEYNLQQSVTYFWEKKKKKKFKVLVKIHSHTTHFYLKTFKEILLPEVES